MSWKFKYYDVYNPPSWDVIGENLEWFVDLKTTPQDPIWHSEGDVQTHTKMVCDELVKLPEFKLLSHLDKHILFTAALCHDIEKRSTTKEEYKDGRLCIVSPKHALYGEFTCRVMLYKELECDYYTREQICKLVRWHGKPLHSVSVKDIVRLATEVRLDLLTMLAKADILGRICQDADEQLEKIEFFKMIAKDLDCFTGPRVFENKLAEHTYLNSENDYIDYIPFDDCKFEVIMFSGLPGSGKDTYIKNNYPDLPVVSLDEIRIELGVKPTDKSGNGRVIQLAKERAKEFMRKRVNFIWNATNITFQLRSQLIDLFKSYGGKVTIVYIEVPYKQLLIQNGNREAALPVSVIEKMLRKLEPPVVSEAHNLIKIINHNELRK